MFRRAIKKNIIVLLLATSVMACSTACGQNEDKKVVDVGSLAENLNNGASENDSSSINENGNEETNGDNGEADKQEAINEEESQTLGFTADNLFKTMSKYQYSFSSGAGGWSTELYVEKDGYFHGMYHDSDMGVTGEGYEDGTMTYSQFTGHFSNVTKKDEYTFECTLMDISYKNEPGTEEIIDNVRYFYSFAYGLDGADYIVHCPGKKLSELNEATLSWGYGQIEEKEELDCFIIECPEYETAFYSYERMLPLEDAENELSFTKKRYNEYDEMLKNEALTQVEMNNLSTAMYSVCDDCLNYIWNLIKYNLDEEKYKTVLDEQRGWLKERDAAVEKETIDYKDGSIYSLLYNSKMAELTLERCDELIAVLK